MRDDEAASRAASAGRHRETDPGGGLKPKQNRFPTSPPPPGHVGKQHETDPGGGLTPKPNGGGTTKRAAAFLSMDPGQGGNLTKPVARRKPTRLRRRRMAKSVAKSLRTRKIARKSSRG